MTKTINKVFLVVPHSILAVFFFLLHDVNENFGLIPVNLFMKYLGIYLAVCVILLAISFYLFKKRTKAFSMLLWYCVCFFRSARDKTS